MMPTKQDILDAYKRVKPWVHRTPVLTSSTINELSGASVFFKCENFQKMGAFKMRGAVNAIQNLSEVQKQKGVVTHSSGNFGQAMALAAKNLGLKAYVVMPENAPLVKKEAVAGYGAEIILCESTLEAREAASENIVQAHGATFLHPSNDINVILGNATATLELLVDYPNVEVVITPVGGGGLLAGTALSAHYFGKNCNTYAGEPLQMNDAYRSLQSGSIETNSNATTLADGLRTNLGDINFPIIQKYVDGIVCVEEDEIRETMKLIWERMKLVVEPSSAVALAAVLKEKETFRNKNIGIIISGGNVDLKKLPFN
ncbi:MAG: pyridoxal-phosphate dependent enzyme [Flavobacteriaceae bacterium]